MGPAFALDGLPRLGRIEFRESMRVRGRPVAEKRVQRKLAAILAADVVGYARLMREDEEATLQTLTEYREVIAGLIDRHNGRVFNTGGDSLLAEFGSVVEAVRCAISFQEEIAICNTELPNDRKLCFRIGINIGDVMVKGDDLFGDGVNVAARLEGLAEPAGICISGSVFEQIKHKLSLGFEDLGPQEVKNISEPVSAFRIVPGSVTVAAGAGAATRPSSAGRWQMLAFVVVAVFIIGAGVAVMWRTLLPPPQEPQKTGLATGTAAPVPDRPSDMSPNNSTGRATSSIPAKARWPEIDSAGYSYQISRN